MVRPAPPVFMGVRTAVGPTDQRKQQRAVRVNVPVISVGNLAVGGTGKSPFVRLLVGWLQEAGHQPAIAMRGYGGQPQRGG